MAANGSIIQRIVEGNDLWWILFPQSYIHDDYEEKLKLAR